jgi:diguanylate cyclase (GGDEF)-like protein
MARQVSLRTLVGTIGFAIAVIMAVAVPVGYFLVAFTGVAETLAFKASLNAGEMARFIYGHDILWQYQRVRIEEQIDLPVTNENPIRQRIFDARNMLVIDLGDALPAPVLMRSVPIVVAGAPVGRIEVETSLRTVLYRTGFVALISCILGFATYFTVRIFPLRVLDRTLEALERTRRQLEDYLNMRFEAALNNMLQGLLMFDAAGRLTTWNLRISDILKLPPEGIAAGMTTEQLMEAAHRLTGIREEDPESIVAQLKLLVRERKAGVIIFKRTNGNIISVAHQPTADGGFVETFDEITEGRRAEVKLSHMACYDGLTDLPNRSFFYEQMDRYLARTARGSRFALLSLDLDRFKSVNDTLGHPVGDKLLQAAAGRMRECIRESDLVARLGGDEFAIVGDNAGEPIAATALASRLIEKLSAPYDLDGHQVIVGTSVGVAIAPGDGTAPDDLMKNADLALYRAKADGGNTYRFFEPQMDARMQALHAIELDLRKAVATGQFELYYQPLVNLRSGNVTSFEALIRWHHPERGLIAPMEFIPIAEATNLIVPLGEWVLLQACADAANWPHDITVSVNLSPAQLKSSHLVHAVVAALEAANCRPTGWSWRSPNWSC